MKEQKQLTEGTKSEEKPVCGIIMPISATPECLASHWQEVKGILVDAIQDAGLTPNLVSDANDSGVIQKRIVQNIYDNEMIICDVSCKNPNVMFELGLRLAFDKPTIIVMDDHTPYSFDTAPIEHLGYPRDLNFYKVVEFKKKLTEKINGTLDAAKEPGYSTFLKHFGEFKVATIENKKGSINDVVMSRLDELSQQIASLKTTAQAPTFSFQPRERIVMTQQINSLLRREIEKYCADTGVRESDLIKASPDNPVRQELQRYLENNATIRKLCGSRMRIERAVEDVLLYF